MNNPTTSSNSGLSLSTVLGVIFIVLKLTGLITWSWLWVLSPFWIWLVVLVVLCVVIGLCAVIGKLLDD